MAEAKVKKPRVWVEDAAIYSALRRTFRNSPAFSQCLESGKEEFFIPSKKGKPMRRVRYKCALCPFVGPKAKKPKKGKKNTPGIVVDHIEPVVDPTDGNLLPSGKRNWSKQISRLIVGVDGLQRLCHDCHSKKSAAENKLRKQKK